jgi:hypothetical protein
LTTHVKEAPVSARRLTLFLVVSLVAVCSFTVAAAARMPTRTYSAKIFVSEKFPAFHGALHSASKFCVAQRPLRVYRRKGGRDILLGRGRSKGDGTWKVSIGRKLTSGEFFVEAPRYGSAALGINCERARSKIVPVD